VKQSLADKIRKRLKESSEDGIDQRDVISIAASIGSWCSALSQAQNIRKVARMIAVTEARSAGRPTSLPFKALSDLYGEGFAEPLRLQLQQPSWPIRQATLTTRCISDLEHVVSLNFTNS
jgi:hypothetical protein